MRDPRLPVTVVTGFLGSGKTTLVNRILAHRRGVGVIVNELGDTDVDGRLVRGARTGELVTLPNGCACCTVRGDLQAAARDLLDRQGPLRRLRHLLVETSGVANPGPVLQTFLVDDALAARTRLDGVVAVVDATGIAEQLATLAEPRLQVGYADHVLLNHTDRADAPTLAAAEAAIHRLNSSLPIQRAVRAAVDIRPLLDLGGVDPGRWAPNLGDGGHTADVRTFTLRTDFAVDAHVLEIWLRFLVGRRSGELWRLKGIVRCRGHRAPVIAQAVYQYLELTWGEGDAPAISEIVFIGRGLDEEEIRRGWERVVASG